MSIDKEAFLKMAEQGGLAGDAYIATHNLIAMYEAAKATQQPVELGERRRATWELLQEPCPIVEEAMDRISKPEAAQPDYYAFDFTDVNNGDPWKIMADTLAFINHNKLATISEKLEAAQQAENALKQLKRELSAIDRSIAVGTMRDAMAAHDNQVGYYPIAEVALTALLGLFEIRRRG